MRVALARVMAFGEEDLESTIRGREREREREGMGPDKGKAMKSQLKRDIYFVIQ